MAFILEEKSCGLGIYLNFAGDRSAIMSSWSGDDGHFGEIVT